jgi:glycosyltransferase involved in cell wall biosynthesis
MKAPIFIGQLELTEQITDIILPERDDGLDYCCVRLLVRMQRLPIGYALLEPDSLEAHSVASAIWRQLSSVINSLRSDRGLSVIEELSVEGITAEEELDEKLIEYPTITVVVCTKDRPRGAIATLRGLTQIHYESFEILIIDNAPSSDDTKAAVLAEFEADPRVRYIREPKPGLSCARNRGVAEAVGDIIAFTDDDVQVDPWWLDGIVRGFQQTTDVACVTGLIPTAQIENAAQLYFDSRETWGSFLSRRIFDLTGNRDESPLYPYFPGIYGAGANFAMAKLALKELGEFDEALGAGSPCGGGEDIEMFMRVILSGKRLVYEPSAIVSHVHRSDFYELSKQMSAYGSGLTAALTSIVIRVPRARLELPSRAISGLRHIFRINNRVQGEATLPSGLMRRELYGMLGGPWLYFKGRRNNRKLTGRISG